MASVDEKVKQIIVEQLGVDEAEVTPKASFVAYGQILTESGQLRGKPFATYEQIVDTSYLRKAYQRLGMKWDEDKVVSQ